MSSDYSNITIIQSYYRTTISFILPEMKRVYIELTIFMMWNELQKWGCDYCNLILQSFSNTPQIIIAPEQYDLEQTLRALFKFYITSAGTTSLTTTLKCPNSVQLWRLHFRFVAIDDKRIEVISSNDNDVSGLTTKTFAFNHNNFNAIKGYITVVMNEFDQEAEVI